jgi:2-polyprenyl-3-methyl-5-hydroxy-6-metoxy-1,4-benzoquinol methylase
MLKLLLRLFIWLHNFSYKAIGSLVVRINNGLHPKHKILKYHNFFINNTLDTDTVLDIGCGNGAVAYDVSKKVHSITGIDIDKRNIKIAEKKFSNSNLKYLVGDATQYDFQNTFDVVILSNVLEHIEDRIKFLSEIKELAPKILIRVPLITRDWLSVYKKELKMEYRLDETHFIEYTEEEFEKEIKSVGLQIESFYVKFGELYAVIK